MKRRSFLPSPSWKQLELAKNFINLFFSIKITYKSFPLQSVCIMYGGVDFATWFLRTFQPFFFFCEIDGEYYSSLHFSTQGRLARNPCKPAVHLYLVAQTAIFQDIFPSEQSCSYLSPANRFVLKNTHTQLLDSNVFLRSLCGLTSDLDMFFLGKCFFFLNVKSTEEWSFSRPR